MLTAVVSGVRAQVVKQPQIHQRLLSILGDLVARERAGEMVDRALIKATTQVSQHRTLQQLLWHKDDVLLCT